MIINQWKLNFAFSRGFSNFSLFLLSFFYWSGFYNLFLFFYFFASLDFPLPNLPLFFPLIGFYICLPLQALLLSAPSGFAIDCLSGLCYCLPLWFFYCLPLKALLLYASLGFVCASRHCYCLPLGTLLLSTRQSFDIVCLPRLCYCLLLWVLLLSAIPAFATVCLPRLCLLCASLGFASF